MQQQLAETVVGTGTDGVRAELIPAPSLSGLQIVAVSYDRPWDLPDGCFSPVR